MNNNNVINPSANARNVDRMALRAENVFIWVAIVGTSVGFFMWGINLALDFSAPKWLAWIVGAALGALSGYVTDYAFRHLLEEVVFRALAWLHPGLKKHSKHIYFKIMGFVRWFVLTIIVVALFLGDWYSVQAVRDPVAAQAKQKPTTDVRMFATNLGTSLATATAPLATQIGQLKADIKAAESRVEAGNPGLVTLIKKDGNSWAAKELSKKTSAATRELRSELSAITKEYNKALGETSKTLTTETQRVTGENLVANADNETKKASLSGLYFWAGFGSKSLSVLLRIFLVISFLYKNPTLDANGDGVVDGKDVTAAAGGF